MIPDELQLWRRPSFYEEGVGQAAPARVSENTPGPVEVSRTLEALSLLLLATKLSTAVASPVPALYEGPVYPGSL